jgi:carbon monoxide dehydrogenase subunit G
MEFHVEADIPKAREEIWALFMNIPEIAACIPGCEQVVEKEKMKSYSAVLMQKLGPFKLNLPSEITVEESREPESLRAKAAGRDKMTGTQISVALDIVLTEGEGGNTRLAVAADMQVAGKLASLGYPVIKKKTEENFEEFKRRLLLALGATGASHATQSV